MTHGSRLWVAVIISACMLFSGIARADQDLSDKQIVIDTIEKIRTSTDEITCYRAALRLASLFNEYISPEEIDDKTIMDITSLIDLPGADLGIVTTIRNLGPRAKIAVPKLLQLLDREDLCFPQMKWFADAIRNALFKIGVTPPSSKCKNQDLSDKQIVIDIVKDIIEKIRTSTDELFRSRAAVRLGILFIENISSEEIDDKTIIDITSLLDMPGAELGIVDTLGIIGPRAKKAVPKLLQLLDKEDICYPQQKLLADAIHEALSKIGVTPPPSKCKDLNILEEKR
jgi:hypothetical protein